MRSHMPVRYAASWRNSSSPLPSAAVRTIQPPGMPSPIASSRSRARSSASSLRRATPRGWPAAERLGEGGPLGAPRAVPGALAVSARAIPAVTIPTVARARVTLAVPVALTGGAVTLSRGAPVAQLDLVEVGDLLPHVRAVEEG